MAQGERKVGRASDLFGWMGAACLLGILPIKLARFADDSAGNLVIGVAPSVLGPAGLLFLILSGTGRMSRLGLLQLTLLVGAFSLTLEFMQLLPRPGFLAHAHYTFDYYDLAGTLCGVVMASAVSAGILRGARAVDAKR